MKFLYYFDRIRAIDHFIQKRSTGTPKELAKRVSISERALYETLSLMKDYGADINYNSFLRSYCYENEGEFEVKFGFKIVENSEKTGGGKTFFFMNLQGIMLTRMG
ncbi:MAG: hypothetical protein JW973_05365 [Bacteroidales bacterium]|nr:hypothetical protein [Bacteroidales bacterium]